MTNLNIEAVQISICTYIAIALTCFGNIVTLSALVLSIALESIPSTAAFSQGEMLWFGYAIGSIVFILIPSNVIGLLFAICATLRQEPKKTLRKAAYVLALLSIPIQVLLLLWVVSAFF
jgi:hypothetical protein